MLVVRASNQAFHEDPSTDAVEHPQDPESAGFQWVKLLIVLHKELQLEPMPFHQGPLGAMQLAILDESAICVGLGLEIFGCARRALILKRCMAETSEAEGRHEGRYHMTWVIPSRRARGALTATSIERRNAPVSTRLLRSEIWSPSAAAPLCSQGRGGARDVRWTGRSVFQLRPHDPSSLGCSIRSLIVSVLFCLWYISEEAGSRGMGTAGDMEN
ncbi:hypothetical protein AK812_SmicGene38069 [Symbiodinium microadriaticum]|uniref:Uncharacterized protein n=1 Tax=Symbiodinium microadriaticum TaxID=2951 RepID=A0A1Q9CET0_SYMMI|nr:hypothetical protein AK812_SmicGene38069 [Symbiodinium microadriaticum]